jgi:hypothetical protein
LLEPPLVERVPPVPSRTLKSLRPVTELHALAPTMIPHHETKLREDGFFMAVSRRRQRPTPCRSPLG